MTVEEVDRPRAVLTDEHDLLLVDFLLVTGLRISERIGLNIGDIDYGRCLVHVNHRYYKGHRRTQVRGNLFSRVAQ